MLYNITYFLYNTCHVMLYNTCFVMLYNVEYVITCDVI